MIKKHLQNVEYCSYLGSTVTDDARCTREIKSRIAKAKAASNKRGISPEKANRT
jgi:hypothetical protein